MNVAALPVMTGTYARPLSLQLAGALWVWRYGCDVVNLHGTENAFILPLLLPKCPVVVTSHGTAYRVAKWGGLAKLAMRVSEAIAARLATSTTAVSSPQAIRVAARFKRPVKYIPNGVESAEPASAAEVSAFLQASGISGTHFWLFAAARIDPIKGCHTLLEAIGGVPNAPPLLVVGDLWHAPGYERQLRDLARELDVVFVPKVESPQLLAGLLRAADLFVFPSTVEAMSIMLLEAVLSGTPVIASDIPENAAILPSRVRVFRAGDRDDLRRQLIVAHGQNPEAATAAALEAAQSVRNRYDWDPIANSYEQVYREAVKSWTERRARMLSLLRYGGIWR